MGLTGKRIIEEKEKEIESEASKMRDADYRNNEFKCGFVEVEFSKKYCIPRSAITELIDIDNLDPITFYDKIEEYARNMFEADLPKLSAKNDDDFRFEIIN